jgi:hypothetical protein
MMHVHAAHPCCVSLLYFLAACPGCISMLHVPSACSCGLPVLQIHAACPCCVHILHFHGVCARCMSMLYVHTACPYCMSLNHTPVNAACPCCKSRPCSMSMLYVRALSETKNWSEKIGLFISPKTSETEAIRIPIRFFNTEANKNVKQNRRTLLPGGSPTMCTLVRRVKTSWCLRSVA